MATIYYLPPVRHCVIKFHIHAIIGPQIPHCKVDIFHILHVKKLRMREIKNVPEAIEVIKYKPRIYVLDVNVFYKKLQNETLSNG